MAAAVDPSRRHVDPEEMISAYAGQMMPWHKVGPRRDIVDLIRSARATVIGLLTPAEFWSVVWDYFPGREPHETMTRRGSRRLLRDVALVYLDNVERGYSRPGFTDRIDAMRALLHTGWHPDPVFLFWAPGLPPGGSYRIADGVGRLTALAAIGSEVRMA